MSGTISGDGGRLLFTSGVLPQGHLPRRPRAERGTIAEPARDVRVFRDLRRAGGRGGPSGTAAAIAARAPVPMFVLLERANHLGGLSPAGW